MTERVLGSIIMGGIALVGVVWALIDGIPPLVNAQKNESALEDKILEIVKKDYDSTVNELDIRRVTYITKDIEEEKINKIIDAGKFTQTSGNMQDVSYVIVKDKIQDLRKMALETLNRQADSLLSDETTPNQIKMYANMWKDMYKKFIENPDGEDKLFFKAPLLIVIKANNMINGALAASKMELMINALGLGTYFSGFLSRAVKFNPEIGKFLQIGDNEELVACMVIGYPKVHYKRTVPRKDVNIIRL
jgi:nitroreductase